MGTPRTRSNRRPRVWVRVAALAVAAAPVSQAALAQSADAGGDWSVYARAGVGAAFANRLDQDLAYDPRAATVPTPPGRRVTEFGGSASPSFALGFNYPSGTRTELEYRFLSPRMDDVTEIDDTGPGAGPVSARPVTPADDFRAHFLMSNAYYEVARAGAVGFFVGAGVGGGFFSNGFGARDAAFAYQGRAGVSGDLSARVSLNAEFVHLRTREVVFGVDRLGRGPVGGSQALGEPFVASSGELSVSFRF